MHTLYNYNYIVHLKFLGAFSSSALPASICYHSCSFIYPAASEMQSVFKMRAARHVQTVRPTGVDYAGIILSLIGMPKHPA